MNTKFVTAWRAALDACTAHGARRDLPVGVGLRFIDTPLRTAIFIGELPRSGRPPPQ